MTTPTRLPDFLIAGTYRAGTTAMYHALGQHPDVFMAPNKEPRYFTERLDRGPGWYASLFTGAGPDQRIGEASPDYLYRRAGERIAATLPGVRVVLLLREPIARATSHYWMRHNNGIEARSFAEVVEAELGGVPDLYVGPGRYAEQLEDLAAWIPRASIHLELFESFSADPAAVYVRVCRFLQITADRMPADLHIPVNAQRSFRSPRLRRLARSWPKPARSAIGRVNTKAFVPPPLDPAIRERLRAHYAEHTQRLARDWIDPGTAWDPS